MTNLHEQEAETHEPEHELRFSEIVRGLGGSALLDLFNQSELTGKGFVVQGTDEMQAVAMQEDGRVHVSISRGSSFNMPYARARELAVRVAREELANVAPTSNT